MNIGEERKVIEVVPLEAPNEPEPVLDPGPEEPATVPAIEPEKEPVGV